MVREQCTPNTVTYNSLITALAQGAQWQKAGEVFEQMQGQGCHPDVVTYTALISAFEKGGQWRLALEVRASAALRSVCAAWRLPLVPGRAVCRQLLRVWHAGWGSCQALLEAPFFSLTLLTPLCSPLLLPSSPRSAPPLLQAYERMKAQGCKADAIVYNAIIDALWETGVVWVQRRALRLFRWAAWVGTVLGGRGKGIAGGPAALAGLQAPLAPAGRMHLSILPPAPADDCPVLSRPPLPACPAGWLWRRATSTRASWCPGWRGRRSTCTP